MSDHKRGSLAWHIAKLYEEKRELECATTFYGWHEASSAHYANISADKVASIDEEIADAISLLRYMGILPKDAGRETTCVDDDTVG